MQVSYRLNCNELDVSFLNSIKELFTNKNIEIVISDEDEVDEKFAQILSSTYENSNAVDSKEFLEALDEGLD